MVARGPNHVVREVVMVGAIGLLVLLAGITAPEAPADGDILRALPPVPRGIPFIFEEFRDDLVIVKNRAGESKVGPQVFCPLIGVTRVVLTNWECVVYYTQTVQSDFPFPVKATKKHVQVIYMEKAELAK
jgi:hypothetical protein